MNYKVIPVDKFKKEAKRLVKKYPSLKSELAELAVTLSANPDGSRNCATTPMRERWLQCVRILHLKNISHFGNFYYL